MFTPIALQRQAKSRWNPLTREADSKTDAELANFLAEDDDLNFTDEPTLDKELSPPKKTQDPAVDVQVPEFPVELMPSMRQDDDSISTFHHGANINLTDVPDEEDVDKVITSTPSPQHVFSKHLAPWRRMPYPTSPCQTRLQEFLPLKQNSQQWIKLSAQKLQSSRIKPWTKPNPNCCMGICLMRY
jgi:hypothetical protein